MKSSNPALGNNTFVTTGVRTGYGPSMTVSGTINRARHPDGLRAGYRILDVGPVPHHAGCVVGQRPDDPGRVRRIDRCNRHHLQEEWSPITAPIYALLEGLVLGSLSAMFELRFPGIAIESVGLTFGTCICMLLAYRSGLIRPTKKLMMGIVAATGGIMLVYIASMVLGLFHVQIPGIFGSRPRSASSSAWW